MILIDRIVTLRSRSPCGERGLKSCYFFSFLMQVMSLPVRGAWIEIRICQKLREEMCWSLPVRGAWIEIRLSDLETAISKSLPVRGAWIEIASRGAIWLQCLCRSPCGERGLKYLMRGLASTGLRRSPCGERGLKSGERSARTTADRRSPCGERGLKYNRCVAVGEGGVAPRAGSVD